MIPGLGRSPGGGNGNPLQYSCLEDPIDRGAWRGSQTLSLSLFSPHKTSPEHPVSCIKPGLGICFTYDILHVSMPFPHIIPPSPSPTESKRLFNISVSLLLSHIQGYHYLLSKFHIYVLIYCIGVFLSGLLHSV